MRITKEEIITARQLFERERKRLIESQKDPDFKKWLGDRSYPLEWMKQVYGETLIEKDEPFKMNGERFDDADCNVCGKEHGPDDRIVHLDFSFCGEYDCGINICYTCLNRLANTK